MGFPAVFIEWIKGCLGSAFFSISLHGSLFGFFQAKKGVRQGDPLSPYLFTIAIEPLSGILDFAASSKRIPYHPQCRSIGLTHLCFADNLLIFTEGSAAALVQMRSLLNEFYLLSGLSCNPQKCEAFFGGQAHLYKENAIELSGFAEGQLPVRYLGLPLFSGRLSARECEVLVDKMTSRIRSWQASKLTYARRLQLISSVLYSLVQYWMNIFILPKKVLDLIHKICSDFLWHGEGTGRAKVALDLVALPKREGGMGLKDLGSWNMACMARLLWLILMKSGSFWVAWLQQYRLKGRSIWNVPLSQSGSWISRKLLNSRS
ncbi:unnamed protein product [Linum trigynum]|uniref:Reverse transcriptase domain-containing protein n=1 Tax=Linum trigynum TaxID=586398 RepID=A0AAV2DXR4_9ROSI